MAKLAKTLLLLAALAWAGGVPVPALPTTVGQAVAQDDHADDHGLGEDAANAHAEGEHTAAEHAEGHAEGHAEEAHGDGHGGHASHDVVEVSIPMLIWQIVLFVVFFAVLAKFVWPPILKGLKGREEKMRSDLVAAETAAQQATATLDQYKKQLADAQQEARRVIDEARGAAEQVAAKVRADAEQQAQQMRERNAAEISAAKEQAIGDIHNHAAELSTQIASRILKREINAQDQQQLVSDSLAELTNRN